MDYKELVKLIKKHNKLYAKGTPEISDEEFDILFKKLEEFETFNPSLKISEKIREERIFYKNADHLKPMLSIRNTYDINELKKILSDFKFPIIMEPKIDGVACSVREGKQLITRGNGYIGEDISRHLNTIENIPDYIYEVRGEIFSREVNRNLVVGALNRKINKLKLEFLPYEIINGQSRIENMLILSKVIKPIHQIIFTEIPENLENIINNFMDKIKKEKIPIDGVVFKLDNIEESEKLGYTARYPRSLIAFKTSSQKKIVEIKDIKWNVTRNGKLVPISIFDGFYLGHTKITKVFCHNKNFLEEKGIGIGSIVEVEKVGEVIPYIKNVIKKGTFPKPICICGSDISDEYICNNLKCPEVFYQKMFFFLKSIKIKPLGLKSLKKIEISNEVDFLKNFIHLEHEKPPISLINKIFGENEAIKNLFYN